MGVNRPDPNKLRVRRWRLVFDMDTPGMRVLQIQRGDRGGVADAVTMFRAAIRHATDAGGCRTVMVGVHVEGEACDHEVGG